MCSYPTEKSLKLTNVSMLKPLEYLFFRKNDLFVIIILFTTFTNDTCGILQMTCGDFQSEFINNCDQWNFRFSFLCDKKAKTQGYTMIPIYISFFLHVMSYEDLNAFKLKKNGFLASNIGLYWKMIREYSLVTNDLILGDIKVP